MLDKVSISGSWAERASLIKMFDARFRNLRERKAAKPTLKGKIYNFLERPTGWRCFMYHFS